MEDIKGKFVKLCMSIMIGMASISTQCQATPPINFRKLYANFLVSSEYLQIRKDSKNEPFVYVKYEPKHWSAVANEFLAFLNEKLDGFKQPNKLPIKYCREQWFNIVEYGSVNGPWSQEEELLLVNKVKELGPKWNIISKIIGRDDNKVREKYLSLSSISNSNPLFYYFKDGPFEWPTQNADEIKLDESLLMNADAQVIANDYRLRCGLYNRYLRSGECVYKGQRFSPSELQRKVDDLKNLLNINNLEKPNVVFRGVDGYGMLNILRMNGIQVDLDNIENDPTVLLNGKTISDPAFLSAADVEGLSFVTDWPFYQTGIEEIDSVNNKFAGSLFVINIKETQQGLPVHELSDSGDQEDLEYEFIMPPNQKLKIYKVIPYERVGTEFNVIYANAIS